jgi:hypothetical protein
MRRNLLPVRLRYTLLGLHPHPVPPPRDEGQGNSVWYAGLVFALLIRRAIVVPCRPRCGRERTRREDLHRVGLALGLERGGQVVFDFILGLTLIQFTELDANPRGSISLSTVRG